MSTSSYARNKSQNVDESKEKPPLKQVMRARFVHMHHTRDLFKKLQELKQGTETIEEYYKEMEITII